MRTRVRFTGRALCNLAAIGEYIGQDDPEGARGVVERLYTAARGLALFPGRGRPGRVFGTRELVVSGLPYLIVYRETDVEVQVLRVLHSSRLWPRHF